MPFTVAKPIPMGSYTAILKSAEENTHPDYGDGIAFRFQITEGMEAGQEPVITCSTERPPTPKNKLGRFLAGFLGRLLQPGESVNEQNFVGKKYVVTIGSNAAGDGTCITSVLPAEPF
jgi:hypothetical protein